MKVILNDKADGFTIIPETEFEERFLLDNANKQGPAIHYHKYGASLDQYVGLRFILKDVSYLIDLLESYYNFECEAGPLKNCTEWKELKRILCLNKGD